MHVVDIHTTVSTTTLNVSGLNTLIKKQSVRVDKKMTSFRLLSGYRNATDFCDF